MKASPIQFDTRMALRNLRHHLYTKKQIDEHLAKLPDLAAKSMLCETPLPESLEPPVQDGEATTAAADTNLKN